MAGGARKKADRTNATCFDCGRRFRRRGPKKWERDFCKEHRKRHSAWSVTKAIVRKLNKVNEENRDAHRRQ